MKLQTTPTEPAADLDLDTDLPVSTQDNQAGRAPARSALTFQAYIEFLEDIGAFAVPKPGPVIFSEVFFLPES